MTGGSGFIGHWVAKELLSRGHHLRLLIRNPGKMPSLKSLPGVEIVEGTLYDRPLLTRALQGCEACVHVALGWGETPTEMLEKDTAITVFLLEEAEKAGVGRFLYTSSTAAVGEFRPLMAEGIDLRPQDLYGATKAASEAYGLGFAAKSKMRFNVIRPGYTFGNPAFPYGVTQPDRRFRSIVASAQRGEPIQVTKHDGTQFIGASDLAKLYGAVLESHLNRRVFFGLSTEFVTWERVAQRATALASSPSKIEVIDKGGGEKPMLFDLGAIEREFGLRFTAWAGIESHLEYLIREKAEPAGR
jgi:UDP-glucose 4-epimerase